MLTGNSVEQMHVIEPRPQMDLLARGKVVTLFKYRADLRAGNGEYYFRELTYGRDEAARSEVDAIFSR